MERRDLGLTGLRLPVIGVGARQAFNVFGKEAQRARRSLIDVALDTGANFFETAPEYGDADGILASGLTGRRNRAIVACSVSSHDPRLAHSQIDRALRLFEEHIDILLVEHPEDWPEFEPVFRQMKSDRMLTAGGVACAGPEDYEQLSGLLTNDGVDVIQIPYRPDIPQAARSILPLAARQGVGVIAAQPFDGGRLLDGTPTTDAVIDLGDAGVRTTPQAILTWILSDRRVCSVLPGTRRARHLRENLVAADPPWLDSEQRDRLAMGLCAGEWTDK